MIPARAAECSSRREIETDFRVASKRPRNGIRTECRFPRDLQLMVVLVRAKPRPERPASVRSRKLAIRLGSPSIFRAAIAPASLAGPAYVMI